jgi:hypothetical protein
MWVILGIAASLFSLFGCVPPSTDCVPSNSTTAERLATHYCEAISPARCYYLDAARGDDSASGTLEAPWQSFRNISSYDDATRRPSRWVALGSGDIVYLFDGTYDQRVVETSPPKKSFLFRFRGSTATGGNLATTIKAYPGNHPVLDPSGQGIGIYLLQTAHWVLQDLEIRNAYERGVALAEASDITLSRLHIHDTVGVDNDNLAGLEIAGSDNVVLSGSSLHDNYDRINADTGGNATENSRSLVLFSAGNVTLRDNVFYQSPSLSGKLGGGCVTYKHASPRSDAKFEVFGNLFENCRFVAFGSGSANTHFHHNVIMGGDSAIRSADFGGPTHQNNQLFEYNTVYRAWIGLEFDPTDDYQNAAFPLSPKGFESRANIFVGNQPTYNQDNSLVWVNAYLSDRLYSKTVSSIKMDANCYSNDGGPAVQLGIAAVNGGAYGKLGGSGGLAFWQSTFGWDRASTEASPLFSNPQQRDFQLLPNSACQQTGAYTSGYQPPKSLRAPAYGCSAGK